MGQVRVSDSSSADSAKRRVCFGFRFFCGFFE
jgi:hypothetical protein